MFLDLLFVLLDCYFSALQLYVTIVTEHSPLRHLTLVELCLQSVWYSGVWFAIQVEHVMQMRDR